MEYIGGEEREQIILMPERVEDYVDENNGVRVIDAYIGSLNLGELGFANAELKETGRPPYDPKDLLKRFEGIRVSSKEELAERIYQYFDDISEDPVVFRWKYKMDEISLENCAC